MVDLPTESNFAWRTALFTEILTTTAESYAGKTKPCRKTKPWMTPHVRTKIRVQNQLRRTINTNRNEWVDACREANKAINKAKTDSWKAVLEGAMTNSEGRDIWRIIKGLNGIPEANLPNEAIIINGRIITDAKSKSNVFVDHYANVSNPPMSTANRALHRNLKKRLNANTINDVSCFNFTIKQLTSAIHQMKGKGAAGPDNIQPTFFKALGPIAQQELLAIFNTSFHHADCPRIWRVAIIIPILKAGKPPSEVASYQPISLTLCVIKLLEWMLAPYRRDQEPPQLLSGRLLQRLQL